MTPWLAVSCAALRWCVDRLQEIELLPRHLGAVSVLDVPDLRLAQGRVFTANRSALIDAGKNDEP